MARVIPDRITPPPMFAAKPPPPPMFTIPPMFSPPPPYFVAPPRFTIPPMFTPPPAIHPALKDRVDGQGNLKVTADTAEALIRNYENKKNPPPPPPMFTAKKPDPVKPPGLPQTPDAIEKWLEPDPVEEPSYSAPVVTPEPSYPAPPPPPPPPPKVKVAPIDTVLFDDDAVPKEIIADLLFESIGGQEILTIARHDTVNGQTVLYQPIKNINILQQQYNPSNLLKLRDTSDTIFGNFTINLSSKIPQVGNGPNGSNTYLDSDGNLVIEFVNLFNDELVEVQLTSSGTIYEAG